MAFECALTKEEIHLKIETELKKVNAYYTAQITFDENYTKLEVEE